MRATVLVLGDLGRSPRMLNHAIMLAETGWEVSLAGYAGAAIDVAVADHPRIRIFFLSESGRAPEGAGRFRFLLISLQRVFLLSARVLAVLLARTPRPNVILVQNPPSIPTLLLARIAAWCRRSSLVIDWHNFGYSMLALRLGARNILVLLARQYERWLGRLADAHFCVSQAMQATLAREMGIPDAVVLYDRPREISRARVKKPSHDPLLVSPTSWTADEPMAVLIEALDIWDRVDRPCHLRIAISGSGPLRADFEKRLSGKRWRFAEVQTLFLDLPRYRDLLEEADVGLSFHRSTSGVDLPMKIMDLLGALTPVCAYDYGQCLREQIEPGRDGLVFRTSEDLAACFEQLFGGGPDDNQLLQRLRRAVETNPPEPWGEIWRRVAAPVLTIQADTRKP